MIIALGGSSITARKTRDGPDTKQHPSTRQPAAAAIGCAHAAPLLPLTSRHNLVWPSFPSKGKPPSRCSNIANVSRLSAAVAQHWDWDDRCPRAAQFRSVLRGWARRSTRRALPTSRHVPPRRDVGGGPHHHPPRAWPPPYIPRPASRLPPHHSASCPGLLLLTLPLSPGNSSACQQQRSRFGATSIPQFPSTPPNPAVFLLQPLVSCFVRVLAATRDAS